VGRARFGAPVGVAYHAARGARDERSTVHPRLTPCYMAIPHTRESSICSSEDSRTSIARRSSRRIRRCAASKILQPPIPRAPIPRSYPTPHAGRRADMMPKHLFAVTDVVQRVRQLHSLERLRDRADTSAPGDGGADSASKVCHLEQRWSEVRGTVVKVKPTAPVAVKTRCVTFGTRWGNSASLT